MADSRGRDGRPDGQPGQRRAGRRRTTPTAPNEDTALVIAAPGVLANDSDVEGDALTAVLVSGPANGTLALNADGSFTYTPAANYNGADSFTYKANDGAGRFGRRDGRRSR